VRVDVRQRRRFTGFCAFVGCRRNAVPADPEAEAALNSIQSDPGKIRAAEDEMIVGLRRVTRDLLRRFRLGGMVLK
jgi:hypothetical protein